MSFFLFSTPILGVFRGRAGDLAENMVKKSIFSAGIADFMGPEGKIGREKWNILFFLRRGIEKPASRDQKWQRK